MAAQSPAVIQATAAATQGASLRQCCRASVGIAASAGVVVAALHRAGSGPGS